MERRFLVRDTRFLNGREGERIVQGYVAREAGAMSTRVRILGDRAYLMLCGPRNDPWTDEFEYRIPLGDATCILAEHCPGRVLQKTRHLVELDGHGVVVDVFDGRHAGLVIARLDRCDDALGPDLPPWIGEEVTDDIRYRSFMLAESDVPVRTPRASARRERPAQPRRTRRPEQRAAH